MGLVACGGGGGGSSSTPNIGSGDTGGGQAGGSGGDAITIDRSLGLVSGGAGLVQGSGVDGVALVGVSGTGLQVGVSGTGLSVGAIQDFGSIIINDDRLNTDAATFTVNGQTATQTDLRQGQQVLVIGDIEGGTAAAVQYRANIVGRLDALTVQDIDLGLATGQSLGQNIEFDAACVYENTEFEELAVGAFYEFSGIVEDDGLLRVTYARQIDAAPDLQLVGEISDPDASRMFINALQIDISSTQLVAFEDNVLEAGDVVSVSLDQFDGQSAVASSVELLPRLILSATAEVEAEGVVDRFVSELEFDIQNQPITTTLNTLFFGGDEQDIELDERLLVVGRIDQSGVLVAQEIFFEPDDSIVVAGRVDAIDLDAEEISVEGIVFDLRDLTDFDVIESLEDLQLGDTVEVIGYLDGAMPVAAEIELESVVEIEIRGPATDLSAGTGQFTVLGVAVQTDPNITEFGGFEDEELSATEFFQVLDNFDFVEVLWDEGSATDQIAASVSLEDD